MDYPEEDEPTSSDLRRYDQALEFTRENKELLVTPENNFDLHPNGSVGLLIFKRKQKSTLFLAFYDYHPYKLPRYFIIFPIIYLLFARS